MTNKNLVEIVTVIDRSASMAIMRDEAISGFNEFLAEQKALPGEADFTLALFNHDYELVFDGAPIKFVKPLNDHAYVPAGTTALLDAVGRTIDSVGARLEHTLEKDRPGKVIFCIITDGAENASKDYTLEQVKGMIALQENTYNWHFIFLAQGLDAFSAGMGLGLGDSTTHYSPDAQGTRQAYKYATYTVSQMRVDDNDNG